MKIISYNVNGIRAAIKKGLLDWIKEVDADIVCFQELKANVEDIPIEEFEKMGYDSYWYSAQKKGYSGVGVISKIKPKNVVYGMDNEKFDFEGRSILLEYDDFKLINTYFPSGTTGDVRQNIKYEFLDFYYDYIDSFKNENLIVVGDYNIAHTEIDIHNPKSNKNTSGFLPEEREWMTKWFSNRMVDSFRIFHEGEVDAYSWWSYRANSRANNKGWRIDYISVSENLKNRLSSAAIHPDAHHSDHCPISIDID